jgi:hypothetical protein
MSGRRMVSDKCLFFSCGFVKYGHLCASLIFGASNFLNDNTVSTGDLIKIKMRLQRIAIYSKDIQRITGKSDRWSRNLIAKIRSALGKEKHQLVTFDEFCEYMGLKKEDVDTFIGEG